MNGVALEIIRSTVWFSDNATNGVKKLSIVGNFAGGLNAIGGSILSVLDLDISIDGPGYGLRLADLSKLYSGKMTNTAMRHNLTIKNVGIGTIVRDFSTLSTEHSAATNHTAFDIKASSLGMLFARESTGYFSNVDLSIEAIGSQESQAIYMEDSGKLTLKRTTPGLNVLNILSSGSAVFMDESKLTVQKTTSTIRRNNSGCNDQVTINLVKSTASFSSPGLDATKIPTCSSSPSHTVSLRSASEFTVLDATESTQITGMSTNSVTLTGGSVFNIQHRISATNQQNCYLTTDATRFFNCSPIP